MPTFKVKGGEVDIKYVDRMMCLWYDKPGDSLLPAWPGGQLTGLCPYSWEMESTVCVVGSADQRWPTPFQGGA